MSVEFAGILPIDFLPYPYSGLMVTVAFSPFFIVATATSQPFMTSPLPSLNSKEPVTESLVVASIIESPPARNKGGIKKKDTRVLKLTAQAIRSAGGGRIVSCKSAKDRTSMSVTAEQVALLRRRHELPESEAQPLLDAMRRDGVRMQNTFKNVGKAGYAFNALQRLLPASLRAPKDTTVSGLEA